MHVRVHRRNESIMIGDNLCVTVQMIRAKRALIVVNSVLGPKSHKAVHGRLSDLNEIRKELLGVGEAISLGGDASCSVLDVGGEHVVLGFTGLGTMTVCRKEVYDAIRRERRG